MSTTGRASLARDYDAQAKSYDEFPATDDDEFPATSLDLASSGLSNKLRALHNAPCNGNQHMYGIRDTHVGVWHPSYQQLGSSKGVLPRNLASWYLQMISTAE